MRKNITLSRARYETINSYAQRCGLSFSEFVRESALKTVTANESLSLLAYLNTSCEYVDDAEQTEIEALQLDFNNCNGRELTLDELLQD